MLHTAWRITDTYCFQVKTKWKHSCNTWTVAKIWVFLFLLVLRCEVLKSGTELLHFCNDWRTQLWWCLIFDLRATSDVYLLSFDIVQKRKLFTHSISTYFTSLHTNHKFPCFMCSIHLFIWPLYTQITSFLILCVQFM